MLFRSPRTAAAATSEAGGAPDPRVAQLEQELAASEQRFRDIAELSSNWFWETDAQHRFVYMSASVERCVGVAPQWHYGKTREQIAAEVKPTGPDVLDYGSRTRFDDPKLRALEWEKHKQAIQRHEPFADFIYPRRGPSGVQWLKTSGSPIFHKNGRFAGYQGVAIDATAFVESERRRVRAEMLLEEAIASLPDGFVVYDDQDRLVICNQAYRDTYPLISGIKPGARFEDILREVNRGMWTIGYTGQSPERLKAHMRNMGAFDVKSLKCKGKVVDKDTGYDLSGDYFGLP